MQGRVRPFAEGKPGSVFFDESCPIASPYFTSDVVSEWNTFLQQYNNNIPYDVVKGSKMFRANQKFIRDLKLQGYTFIDCGDGGLTSPSAFYDFELSEIF